jgi:ABC-2 type transport system permease protein
VIQVACPPSVRGGRLTIAVKDATEIWRDGRFRWAAGLLLFLSSPPLPAAFTTNPESRGSTPTRKRAERDVWLDKGDMNPHAPRITARSSSSRYSRCRRSIRASIRSSACSCFSRRTSSNSRGIVPIEDATPTRRLGQLTPASAALCLLPLLVVALTFSSFAGERDQGTLRPLLRMGVSRRRC